jgi:hypothetical protein
MRHRPGRPHGFLFELALVTDDLRDPEPHVLVSNEARAQDIERDRLPRALRLHRAHAVSPVMGAMPAGRAPDQEPGNLTPIRLAELGWQAAKGTARMLRRSTDLVPYLLVMAAREMYARPGSGDQPLAAGSGPRPDDGMGVVIDLAAYRRDSQRVRAARVARNAPPRC